MAVEKNAQTPAKSGEKKGKQEKALDQIFIDLAIPSFARKQIALLMKRVQAEFSISERTQLAEGLCDIFSWFEKQSKRPKYNSPEVEIPSSGDPLYHVYCNWQRVPYPGTLLEQYVNYLKDAKGRWLQAVPVSAFDHEGKIFRNFLIKAQNTAGIDYFTGRSIS